MPPDSASAVPGTVAQVNLATNKPSSALVRPAATAPAADDDVKFALCHMVAAGTEYYSGIFPTTGTGGNKLPFAFWQSMTKQFHLGTVKYQNNVACAVGTEAEMTTALATLKSTPDQRGATAGKAVDSDWTYTGIAQ